VFDQFLNRSAPRKQMYAFSAFNTDTTDTRDTGWIAGE